MVGRLRRYVSVHLCVYVSTCMYVYVSILTYEPWYRLAEVTWCLLDGTPCIGLNEEVGLLDVMPIPTGVILDANH